jgi:hypothetical protein
MATPPGSSGDSITQRFALPFGQGKALTRRLKSLIALEGEKMNLAIHEGSLFPGREAAQC